MKDVNKLKNVYETNQDKFQHLTNKYESIMKEKMIMKLEKDRLKAKVQNLERSLAQVEESSEERMAEQQDF